MLNLFGYQSIPIDRHLFSFLKLCLVETNNYQFASSIFNDVAEKKIIFVRICLIKKFGIMSEVLEYKMNQ